MRKSIKLLPVICLLAACGQKKAEIKPAKKHFSYFELNYRGGWIGGVQFCVDSNKVFFIPRGVPKVEGNKIVYGLLPDSIFNKIDSIAANIKKIKTLNPHKEYCDDCDRIACKVISGGDSILLYQEGNVETFFYPLIDQLEKIRGDSSYNHFKTIYFMMQTDSIFIPVPKVAH